MNNKEKYYLVKLAARGVGPDGDPNDPYSAAAFLAGGPPTHTVTEAAPPAIGSRAWRGRSPTLKQKDLLDRDKSQFDELSDYADNVVNKPQAPGGPGAGQFLSTSRGHYDAGEHFFGGVTNRPAAHPLSTMPAEQVKKSPEFNANLRTQTPNRKAKPATP